MLLENVYITLLEKKRQLEKDIELLKEKVKNNRREFENTNFIEIDISRDIKCRKELRKRRF